MAILLAKQDLSKKSAAELKTLAQQMQISTVGVNNNDLLWLLALKLHAQMPRGSKQLVPLTIDLIRKNYWDSTTKTGKPIKCYIGQTFGGLDGDNRPVSTTSKNFSVQTVTVWGNLVHKWGDTIYPPETGPIFHQYTEIIPDWLSSGEPGPYVEEKASKDFYYLQVYIGDDNKYQELQICSGPLNVLSTDCLDEVNCWVESN